jgi:hypothetical protein
MPIASLKCFVLLYCVLHVSTKIHSCVLTSVYFCCVFTASVCVSSESGADVETDANVENIAVVVCTSSVVDIVVISGFTARDANRIYTMSNPIIFYCKHCVS